MATGTKAKTTVTTRENGFVQGNALICMRASCRRRSTPSVSLARHSSQCYLTRKSRHMQNTKKKRKRETKKRQVRIDDEQSTRILCKTFRTCPLATPLSPRRYSVHPRLSGTPRRSLYLVWAVQARISARKASISSSTTSWTFWENLAAIELRDFVPDTISPETTSKPSSMAFSSPSMVGGLFSTL